MQNEEIIREWIEKSEEHFGFASSSLEIQTSSQSFGITGDFQRERTKD